MSILNVSTAVSLHLYAVKIIRTPQASLVLQGFISKKYPSRPLSKLHFFTYVRAVFTFFLILEQSPTFAELTVDISATFKIDKKKDLDLYKDFYGIFSAFLEVSGVTPLGWGDSGH